VKNLLIILVLLIGQSCPKFAYSILAQSREEILCLKLKPYQQPDNGFITYSQQTDKEIQQFTGWLFRFYKKFISSQDHGNCSFTPSCSEYAIIAIREEGLLIGSVNTLDRLTRCHGKNNPHYPKNKEKDLLIDEVRDHNYEKD
jgi:uncharacterized protein